MVSEECLQDCKKGKNFVSQRENVVGKCKCRPAKIKLLHHREVFSIVYALIVEQRQLELYLQVVL